MEKIGYTSNQPIKKEGKEFFESNVVKGLRKIKEERREKSTHGIYLVWQYPNIHGIKWLIIHYLRN